MPRKNKVDRKVRVKKIKIIFFFLLLTISLFLFIVLKTDLFNISKIEVKGNKKIPDEKIIKASGSVMNENIFHINKKTIKDNLALIPYIKEVEIKRKLPNKILINIVEREEKVVLSYIGSFIYLNEEGYVLTIEDEKKENNLPELIGPEIDKPNFGECLFDSNEAFEKLDDFLFLANEIDIFKKFVRIDIRDKKNIIIQLDNGTGIEFGSLDDIKYKLSFLDSILKDVNKKGVICKRIYLNRGENPIIVTDIIDETN